MTERERGAFRGAGPALVTPMTADGEVDYGAFRAHVDFVVRQGVHFVVPCGTTGESATLTGEEQVRVIEAAVEAADGRVPVMAGAGTNDTRDACARAKAAAEAGADAILSVSPYYNKPTREGLVRHFTAVAEAGGLPLFVYNVPGRTASHVPAETILRLARECDLVAGVKEASGDVQQAMTLLRERPDGFLVLSGEDHLTFPLMALGADGVISVVANEAPADTAALTGALLDDRMDEARRLHARLLPLMRANFVETNPIPVKAALEMMGRMKSHHRLPLTPLDPRHRPALARALREAGLIDEDGEAPVPGDAGRGSERTGAGGAGGAP